MLEQIRSLISAALDERDASQEAVEAILALAETEGRSDMTAEETEKFDVARAELREIDDKITALQARESDLVDLATRSDKAAEVRKEVLPMNVKVVSEEQTYRADSEHDFLSDAIAAKFGNDSAAGDRLARAREEALYGGKLSLRSTSGNFGGLVVPQYLTEQFAATLASGRPFLENVTKVALPEQGMNMVIPRGATSTGVAAQTTEGTGVTNQTFTESDLTVPVRTFAGQQVVSRQSIDRGTGIGQILLADLYQQYATKVNVSAISGDGTAGGHFGILNTTSVQTAAWTGTTGASLVAAIHNGLGKINTSRYAAADLIVMHPRRWAWLCAQSDSSLRPLVAIEGYNAFNSSGAGIAAGYGPVGSIAGVPVVTDAGVPIVLGASTDEDRIIITRKADVLFMEDGSAPIGLTLNEVAAASLNVTMVTYGYSAFTAGRYPVATCNLQGTGFKQVLS
jgi:HK97 family phage major capsid protein